MAICMLHHFLINVKDIEATKRFYEDVVGLKAEKDVIMNEGTPDSFRRVSYPVGHDITLGLAAPLGPQSVLVNKMIEEEGEGLTHYCLTVDDAESVMERCRAAGIRLTDQRWQPWKAAEFKGKPRIVFFTDPRQTHNTRIEFLKYL